MNAPKSPEKILVMNMTRMGDLVQSTPLLMGLRKRYPDAEIVMMVSRDFSTFSNRLPGVDRKVVFDLRQFTDAQEEGKTHTWIPIYRYLEEFLETLGREKFDVVYNLSHSKLSALMIAYLSIPKVCGFRCSAEGDRMTEHPWLQYFFTEPFNRPYNTFNLVDIFTRGGDISPEGQTVSLLSEPEDNVEVEKIFSDSGIEDSENVIAIQAGSSLEGRRWPASRFAALADYLVEGMNARIVLLGVKSESAIAESILNSMKHSDRATDLTGKTSIGGLAGLLKKCTYLVTNDTGTMHIAAAVGTPIVGLFFAHAHPPETGPYATGHLIFQARITCAPCSYGVECNNIICIEKVRPELVYSFMEKHAHSGMWEVPEGPSLLNEVNAFVTEFDEDHCLVMRPLFRHSVQVENIFGHSYRRLWLDTLTGEHTTPQYPDLDRLNNTLFRFYDLSNFKLIENDIESLMGFIQELNKLADLGLKQVEAIANIYRQGGASQHLQDLADGINRLDERINLIGLTHPEIKPLTDMFNKRKENLDGEDVHQLAEDTRTCYQKLNMESRFLFQTLKAVVKGINRKEGDQVVEVNSMRMEVPGR